MGAVRLSWLARNGRSPGEESLTAAVAAQAIEAQPSFGQIKPSEATWVAPGPTALRKKTWRKSSSPHKRPPSSGEGKETLACRWASLHVPTPGRAGPMANRVAPDGGDASIRSKHCNEPRYRSRAGDPKSAQTAIEIANDGSSALLGQRRQRIRRYHVGGNALSGVGRGAASAIRAQAVAATMIAPATAIACRQSSAGTPMCARPSAA